MSTKSTWFNEARYGMFIHWGPYSAGGRGEWIMNRERIPAEEYAQKYAEAWRAERYDPAAWARLAREGGMGYVVLTTRHHDGFALWETETTSFHAARMGPRRDLVAEFVEAVRAEGLRVGFYYSVADWTHPDYPDAFARDWPEVWPDEAARRRFVAYYRAQLGELFTRYGKIDLLWYDGCIPAPTDGDEVNAYVRSLQPDVLINNRNGGAWDFHCCEQTVKPAPPGTNWEACMTLNSNWGYHAGDDSWKSPRDVIQLLTETAAGGGNLLLNVGPRPDGTLQEPCERIIREVGAWLARNGEFLPGSSRSPFAWFTSGRLTVRGSTVYLHLFFSPGREFCLAEIGNRVLSAHWLDRGEPVSYHQRDDGRLIFDNLPVPLPDPLCSVIALEVEGEPRALRQRTTFWIPE